jgi:4-hydroxy-3-polyprenylbenzoate decarboxylase
MWLGAPTHGISQRAGLVWDQIEAAGVPNVVGVYFHTGYLLVVAIKQAYAGHAKQAAMAAMSSAAGARNGRYVVVVDEDIDPTNLKEVVWAMQTRVDPVSDIETVGKCWSTPLDPRMPPENRANKDHTNSRAVFYAVRPWAWRDQFPMVNRTERELLSQVMNKYRGRLPFPDGL